MAWPRRMGGNVEHGTPMSEHSGVFSQNELKHEDSAYEYSGPVADDKKPTPMSSPPRHPTMQSSSIDLRHGHEQPLSKSNKVMPLASIHKVSHSDAVVPPIKSPAHKPALKRILFWTKYFYSRQFQFGFGQWPFLHYKCPVNTCTATDDKSTLADADVLMFHGPLIRELPKTRRPKQLYVFVQKEPWLDKSAKTLHAYNDMMNLTMTYRTDSDILFPYGTTFTNHSLSGRKLGIDPQARSRSIVWPVSHCETDSKRELYVKELQKYIDIDVYGECGNLVCSKQQNPECWQMFARNYRFVLSFENDVCKDYITEKAYRPLQHDIIPIVYGGADYKKLTPHHSVIDIKDYPNPKDLAKYLKYLSKNKEAYNDYLKWKINGLQVETYKEKLMVDAFCDLCALLHKKDYKFKRYKDLRKWWLNEACDRHAMDKIKALW